MPTPVSIPEGIRSGLNGGAGRDRRAPHGRQARRRPRGRPAPPPSTIRSGALAVAAEMLVAEVNDKFQSGGPGWPPLAESTLARRRGSVAQILVDTGRLAGSIHGVHGADFAEAATDVSYAVYT